MTERSASLPARLWAFLRLGRPLFLAGGFVFCGLGAAIAVANGHPFSLLAYALSQLAVTATQWMTQYANEYFDLEADRHNTHRTRWAGGSGVLVEGLISARTALTTALILMAVALSAAIALGTRSGLLVLGLVLLGIAAAWEYSAPPLRLHSSGYGEITAALTVTVLTPLVGYAAQAGTLGWLPVITVIPLSCLQFAMLLTVDFPDIEGDTRADKRTLVVRAGGARAARLHNASLALAYLLLPLAVLGGLPPVVAGAMALGAPVAAWQGWRVARGAWADPARHDSLAFWGIGLLIGTGALALAAFLVLMRSGAAF